MMCSMISVGSGGITASVLDEVGREGEVDASCEVCAGLLTREGGLVGMVNEVDISIRGQLLSWA